jgi:hypothetical protein
MRIFLLILHCLLLAGCFTTRLEAPQGNNKVRIMAENERATFHKEYKDWYLLSGLLPIWRTDIAELITKERLTEVRVQTEDRVSDGVITLLTEELLLGLYPQSIVIEGNTVSPGSIIIEDTTKQLSQPQHRRPVNQQHTTASAMTGSPSAGIPIAAPLP